MKLTCIIISLFLSMNVYAQEKESIVEVENFDFLVGKWSILNKRLKERLNNSNEWSEFMAEAETKKSLNGLCVMDEFRLTNSESTFAGLSLRLLNPKTNEWTIYWTDTANPELKLSEQVVGKFENGIGLFYGSEKHKGKEVKLRFTWKQNSLETAYWDQAYFDEKKNDWEINWIMEFTKIKS